MMDRRDYLMLMGAAAGTIGGSSFVVDAFAAQEPMPAADEGAPTTSSIADRTRRMKWWHAARFGMFIHWGLYSVAGRHEWVMENEGIPVREYEPLAQQFQPKANAAREWARLARRRHEVYGNDHKTSRGVLQL